MDVAEQIAAGLKEFVDSVPALQQHDDVDDISSKDIVLDPRLGAMARSLAQHQAASDVWDKITDSGLQISALCKALGVAVVHARPATALQVALLYSWILLIPNCPVVSLLSELAVTGTLRTLQHAVPSAQRSKGGKQGGGGGRPTQAVDDDGDVDMDDAATALDADAGEQAEQVLINLQDVLRKNRLSDNTDALTNVSEAAVALLFTNPTMPVSMMDAIGTLLITLASPMQGHPTDTSCTVLRTLTDQLLRKDSAAHKTPVWGVATHVCLRIASSVPNSTPAVVALIHNLLLRAPDKADCRGACVALTSQLMKELPAGEVQHVLLGMWRLARSAKLSHRTAAVEFASEVLSLSHALFDDPNAKVAVTILPTGHAMSTASPAPRHLASLQQLLIPTGAAFVAVLLARCNDKAPVVRAKAITALGTWLSSWAAHPSGMASRDLARCLHLAMELRLDARNAKVGVATPGPRGTPLTGATIHGPATGDMHVTPASVMTGAQHCFVVDSQAVVAHATVEHITAPLLFTALQRCRDEKGPVRKAGLVLLEALLLVRHKADASVVPDWNAMEAVRLASRDPLVTVRRAALTMTCALLHNLPDVPVVAQLLVDVLLPMAHDGEPALRDAMTVQLQELVFAKLTTIGNSGRTLAAKTAAELHPILIALSYGRMHVEVCLQACCQLLAEKKTVKVKPCIKGLQYLITHAVDVTGGVAAGGGATAGGSAAAAAGAAVNTHSVGQQGLVESLLVARVTAGAWMVLAALLPHEASAANWEFLATQWKTTVCTQKGSDSVTMRSAVCLLQAMAAAGEQCPPTQAQQLRDELLDVARTLRLPAPLMAAHIAALATLSGDNHTQWAPILISAAEKVVAGFVEGLQSSTSSHHGIMADVDAVCAALFAIGEVVGTSGCAVHSQVVVLVQALLSPGQTLAPTQQYPPPTGAPADEYNEGLVAPRVQAQAWTTLGKLCVVNAALAKRCAPVFVQELSRNPLPAVRNNIVVVLRDLCVHFTALVDGHVPKLLRVTYDTHALVRTQALALLANLLQKDYMKWRGPVLHRFVVALVDDQPQVRALGRYLLEDALATKAFMLTHNHLVEAIFSLNNCPERLAAVSDSLATQASQTQGDAGRQLLGPVGGEQPASCRLDGDGQDVRENRMVIYRELLQRMSPEHKFSCSAKLCVDVLGACIDGALPLDSCAEVIRDVLCILATKEIQVSTSQQQAAERDTGEELGTQAAAAASANAQVAAAKGRLMNTMIRKHLLEQVVPVLVELHRMLTQARHPLLGPLMKAAAAMLKEHKGELDDIFVGNRQLAKELLHDMQHAEKMAQQQQQQQQQRGGGGVHANMAGNNIGALAGNSRTGSVDAAHASRTAAGTAAAMPTPVGTTRHTPIAAQVIVSAARDAEAAASPMGVGGGQHRATPRGGGGMGGRAAAYTTPAPASGGGGGAGSTGVSGGVPTHTTGGSNTSTLSVPHLKGRGQRRMGPSRLRPGEAEDIAMETNTPEDLGDKENDDGMVDVVLPRPQPHSTAKAWRVSLPGDQEEEEEDEQPVAAKPAAAARGRRGAQGKGKADTAVEVKQETSKTAAGRRTRGKAVLQEQASPPNKQATRRTRKR